MYKKFLVQLFIFMSLILTAQFNYAQDTNYYVPKLEVKLFNYTNEKPNFKAKELIVPIFTMTAGFYTNFNADKHQLVNWRNHKIPSFATSIDDYLLYSPMAIVYILDAFDHSAKTDILNRSVILMKSEAIMLAGTLSLKYGLNTLRPDLTNFQSFPSGHTAHAFMFAAFLAEEYKHKYKWMPYLAYGIASAVGIMRMANNRHYFSDVLFGAGIGILSVKIAYWTHQYKWFEKRR